MKTLIMTITTSYLVLLFAVYTMSFPPQIHSRVSSPTNENKFIEEMCTRTPNHDLCTSILRADPRSKDTDGVGLTRIVVGVVEARAKKTLNHINDLIKGSSRDQKQALISCANYYNKIITADVPKAIQGLDTVVFKLTEQGADDATNKVDLCQKGFSGSSPLADMNKYVHDTAAVTAAMARVLMDGPF